MALNYDIEYPKLEKHLQELEAQNARLREERLAFATHNAELEARLQRIGELPDKWREISYKTTEEYTDLHGCADELQAASDE